MSLRAERYRRRGHAIMSCRMSVIVQKNGAVICDHCGINLELNRDKFVAPGTYYHPQDAWYAEMVPKIVESSKTCPNSGWIFRVRDGVVK